MEQKTLEQALREQADKLAQAEERTISRFLSALAHELRGPLSPMLSSVHVVRRAEDPSQRARASGDREHRQALLSVSDDGAGIEAHLLPKLWYAFAQAEQSLQRAPGGLGLGLALVRSLVELHGGQVEAWSSGPGCGAEFSVKLALAEEPAALSGKPTAQGHVKKPLRILVIEDNQDAAESLRILLELLGHEVAVTRTGVEGVRAARQWQPNFVLSDIGLPGGLDGWGVARELRQNPSTAQTRLIAITGYGRDEDRRHAREVGFDHLLTKPADPDILLRLIGC